MTSEHLGVNDGCGSCELHERRRFLVRAAAFLTMGSALLPAALQAATLSRSTLIAGTRDRWGRVRYPIPAADGVSIDAENEVIIVRIAGSVIAFALACPHQRAMLRQKRGDTAFKCPKHKSEYKADGVFIRGRATRNMDRRSMQRDGDELSVDIESLIRSDENGAAWQAATIAV